MTGHTAGPWRFQAPPCPRCVLAAYQGKMRREPIQPLPSQAPPRARDTGEPCCHDCALADTLVRLGYVPDWDMARVAVANDRQEQLRLPGATMGLVQMGLMRPSQEGDLDAHHAWLAACGLGYGEKTL